MIAVVSVCGSDGGIGTVSLTSGVAQWTTLLIK
jgi:hypothetical protein